jgi:uncharacterized Zn finger protein
MGESRPTKSDRMTGTPLGGFMTELALKRLAGDRYFERGEAYYRSGAVAGLREDAHGVTARVIGSEPYLVRLWLAGRDLRWGCSCPLGVGGEFCKHLVAAGLAWLSHKMKRPAADAARSQAIQHALRALDERALADLVADRATWDDAFFQELSLSARAREDTRKTTEAA